MVPMPIFNLALFIGCLVFHPAQSLESNDGWMLRVLHTNDMHSRFHQTSVDSNDCSQKLAERGQCFGGFARLATLVRHARTNSTGPIIFLNAGDTYKGTRWFTAYRWRIVAKFLSILEPDAMSLGNHEFDDAPAGLIPFINNTSFPIVAANLNFTNEPKLAESRIQKSVVLNKNGHRIGVIGYLTPETKIISATGQVIFVDEIEAIREEVMRLRAEGVGVLIALGHSGFEVDKKIAAEVEGLDLVIGAHDNTFLYNGDKPSTEAVIGPYPTVVHGVGGRNVYVVQAYAYTKYLGDLNINFNSEDEIVGIQGNPILVDNSIEQAQDVLEELKNNWQSEVDKLNNMDIGVTRVSLDGRKIYCRLNECNMGNLIVDAMIDYNLHDFGGNDGWTDAAIAIQPSGTIQASIPSEPGQKITMGNIVEVLPFHNGLVKVDLLGSVIRQMLEHSVEFYNISSLDPVGSFLHFSGLRVTYNLFKPVGSRVVSVLVRCANCQIPNFEPLEESKTYKVLTVDFLMGGGDGYTMLKNITSHASGITTDQLLAHYITHHSPVYPGIDGRIKLLNTHPDQ